MMQATSLFFSRDLSWLSFNERLLQEAGDAQVPLAERIKFLAIYSANLREFYQVRIPLLRKVARLDNPKQTSGGGAEGELIRIEETVTRQLNQYGTILRDQLLPALRRQGVYLYYRQTLPPEFHPELTRYFRRQVLGHLQLVELDNRHGESHALTNRQPYLIFQLRHQIDQTDRTVCVNIPTDQLSRFFSIESPGINHVIFLDDVIRMHYPLLFPDYYVLACHSVVLSRDANLQWEEEEYRADLSVALRKKLARRQHGKASRFLYDWRMPKAMLAYVQHYFGLVREDMVTGGEYHNLDDLMKLPYLNRPVLKDTPQPPLTKASLESGAGVLESVMRRNELLFFPYHDYDYVLRLFREASVHPAVTEIYITLYRMAEESQITEALIAAARNGKRVHAFVELKARFDEHNNLRWADQMRKAGVQVTYQKAHLKVHAKISLIKLDDHQGSQYLSLIGTGNFNEKTARQYSDTMLITSDPVIAQELQQVADFLFKTEEPPATRHLLVAPFNLQSSCLHLIDQEIRAARQQRPARIVLKLNNLEDPEMIRKLYKASQAGVEITLLIRSICCLRPQVPGLSDNITVIRLVDRYLEHARVYWFHANGAEKMYVSSADWMQRNLHRRVEVGVPITNAVHRAQLQQWLQLQLQDTAKAVTLSSRLENKHPARSGSSVRAQEASYQWLKKEEDICAHLFPIELS